MRQVSTFYKPCFTVDIMAGEEHLSGGAHAEVHDKVCICPHCKYRMIKDEDVACGLNSCPKCGKSLIRA